MHTSLLRILTPLELTASQTQAIVERCAQLTALLRGRKLQCKTLWYLIEETYATVQGQTTELPLGRSPG